MAESAIKQNESDVLEAPFEVGDVQAGNPLPIGGAHQSGDGVTFVLFSRHATRVHLELYQNTNDSIPTKIIDLDPARHRAGDVWHKRTPLAQLSAAQRSVSASISQAGSLRDQRRRQVAFVAANSHSVARRAGAVSRPPARRDECSAKRCS